MGTMAWLTSQADVTNTFTVGEVEITLDEADVDEYGVPIVGAERVTENDYKMLPGKTYTKDPIVHVTEGSEASYVFVKVENGLAAFEAAEGNIESQILANGWTKLENGVYYQTVAKGAEDLNLEVFETFTLADNANDIEGYGNATITVTAYAIQLDGFEDEPADAWTTVSAN